MPFSSAQIYPPSSPVIQQTFMGLSIKDFSINLGFNSNSSSLSINLVKDDANYKTWKTLYGRRDAVTEGYHPWDINAFPKPLIAKYGGPPPYDKYLQDDSGDIAYFPRAGSPVYFEYYDGSKLTKNCVSASPRNCEPVFSFPGILGKFERSWSTSGETYTTSVTDPRQILENTKIILDGYAGRTGMADGHFNIDSTRVFDEGWNGYYNIVNVFGFWENHRFGQSQKNDKGMEWFSPSRGQFTNEYGGKHFRGILPAIDFMLSGTNSKYIKAMEPFGGPIYYGEDTREIASAPPFGTFKNLSTGLPFGANRYAVDLSSLYDLNSNYNPNPPTPGILPDDFRVSGESMSLLGLIQQICDAASCDFFVWLYAPRHSGMQHFNTHKDYAGIIKVTPIPRNMNIRIGVLSDAFDQAIAIPPKGPWIDAEQNTTMLSANLGYEFTDPVAGQMLMGAQRTRVVGVTPLGNYKYRPELFFNKQSNQYLDTDAGHPKTSDDVLKEFLPSIEMDGVTLTWQNSPTDEFKDKRVPGWNPYTDTGIKKRDTKADFKQNLPMISNDDYLPWHWPQDYVGPNFDQANPFQFNRVNSSWELNQGYCNPSHYCTVGKGNPPAIITDPVECDGEGGEWKVAGTKAICETEPFDGPDGIWKDAGTDGDSGYLDLFPCWGFMETQHEVPAGELGDILDIKAQGRPIKGFFWDDDPYRDFHPSEGIFSNIEFWNPALGECVAEKNYPDPPAPQQFAEGEIIAVFENKPGICECDPMTSAPDSECVKQRAGNEVQARFRPYCMPWADCQAQDLSFIKVLHEAAAGVGNNIHKTRYGCMYGCFKMDNNNMPMEPAIVAYYTKDHGTGASMKKKGEKATIADAAWRNNPPGTNNSPIQFVKGDADCVQSGTLILPTFEKRASHPINKTGLIDMGPNAPTNIFNEGDGLYSLKCQAISLRKPWFSHCQAIKDLLVGGEIKFYGDRVGPPPANVAIPGDWTDDLTAKACQDNWGGLAKWVNAAVSNGPPIVDVVKGKTIPTEDFPSPGYINTRVMYTGVCEDPANPGQPMPAPPKSQIHNDEKACIKANGIMNFGEGMPTHPKTATIPVDLSSIGYAQGPEGARNFGAKGAKGWYYLTVTELRHAAVSKDAWVAYSSEFGQLLGCSMYAQDPFPASRWSDLCKAANPLLIKGGASQTEAMALGSLPNYAKGGKGHPVNAQMRNHAGNQEDAAAYANGYPCGDSDKGSGLTKHEKTVMELDIAYKKIQELATQYYGRKYLMALPFNPPTSLTCSNPGLNKTKCENEGFDWGPHGMVSDWFAKMGVGVCSDDVSPDKFTCEVTNGKLWIEPAQQTNKWEITSGGWPGGAIDFKFDGKTNTGYPQNMNFWTDDGNLQSFAIYPTKDFKRFSGDEAPLDFRALGPESTNVSSFPAGPNGSWGTKLYVKTNIDPKTYWLPVRPDWEIQNEKQMSKYQAGDPGQAPEDWKPVDFAEIGTQDNRLTLDERQVFTRLPGQPPKTAFREAMAYKPYALITLPGQVLYGDVDRATTLASNLGGDRNEMCIPLTKCKSSNCLAAAWIMGQNPQAIAVQQLKAMAAGSKNAPKLAPDMGRGSIQAAAYKPWHAAVPQQSTHYKWGPWALGKDFGKPEFEIDTSIHPATFGGETRMNNFALSKVGTALSESQSYVESGSVTLAGLPAYAFGSQMALNFNGVIEYGPFISDMSVSMGTGGLTTTYNFSTQRKFGDLSKIYEDSVKQLQKDMIDGKKKLEEALQRSKRNISSYQK